MDLRCITIQKSSFRAAGIVSRDFCIAFVHSRPSQGHACRSQFQRDVVESQEARSSSVPILAGSQPLLVYSTSSHCVPRHSCPSENSVRYPSPCFPDSRQTQLLHHLFEFHRFHYLLHYCHHPWNAPTPSTCTTCRSHTHSYSQASARTAAY